MVSPRARRRPGGTPGGRGISADPEAASKASGGLVSCPAHGPPCSLACPPMGLFRVEGAEDQSPYQLLSPSDEATTVIRRPPLSTAPATFAVVRHGGHQYRVSAGDRLVVDRSPPRRRRDSGWDPCSSSPMGTASRSTRQPRGIRVAGQPWPGTRRGRRSGSSPSSQEAASPHPRLPCRADRAGRGSGASQGRATFPSRWRSRSSTHPRSRMRRWPSRATAPSPRPPEPTTARRSQPPDRRSPGPKASIPSRVATDLSAPNAYSAALPT